MAQVALRNPDDAPGPWFVDRTCIDCGTCRVVAPAVFGDARDHAVVTRQPSDAAATHRAAMALVACPVSAIGTTEPADTRAAIAAFPDPVAPGVHHLGLAARETYGASSWLLVRPEGNVMIDVPRAVRPLLAAVERLGGVRHLVLTHRDDVHGHDVVAAHFGATRVVHAGDAGAVPGAEVRIEGTDPVAWEGLTLVPTPGHTRGSMCLLAGDVLFTGDHLWARGRGGWDQEGRGPFGAGRSVCWYSWPAQTASMERLRDLSFAHVLPGHGRPWHGTPEEARAGLDALVAWMRADAGPRLRA